MTSVEHGYGSSPTAVDGLTAQSPLWTDLTMEEASASTSSEYNSTVSANKQALTRVGAGALGHCTQRQPALHGPLGVGGSVWSRQCTLGPFTQRPMALHGSSSACGPHRSTAWWESRGKMQGEVEHRSTAWWESRGKMQSGVEHRSTAWWESRGNVQCAASEYRLVGEPREDAE